MSKELIEAVAAEMNRLGYGYHESHAESIVLAMAKAAPVGERDAYEAWKLSMKPYGFDGFDAYQAGAAYQRAQQPQSAEAVAYVLTRDGEICYEADDGIVISNTPGDETDLYKWQPVYFTTPQPSAGVVMPGRAEV